MIKLPGNSNASVDLVNRSLIKKIFPKHEKQRAIQQIKKQIDFVSSKIKTPTVFDVTETSSDISVLMEYVVSQDFVTYTSTATKFDYIQSIETIVDFIINQIDSSKKQAFHEDKWLQKLENVTKSIKLKHGFDIDFKVRSFLEKNLPKNIIVNSCHGDLTFSNILVGRQNQLYFIDFLDPIIETPYEDIAKFLQDAEYFWSLQKYRGNVDQTKVKIYWNYAAKHLYHAIDQKIDIEVLRKIQTMSLLRILPYSKTKDTTSFLLRAIEECISCF